MKTVQITLDEPLARDVDRAVEQLGTTRSGFTREALRDALSRLDREQLERRHRQGYERHPVKPGEFDLWEDEQVWVE
ncbi:MAG TPA: ribbon-helix-helix domain-containing protein [Thermoanaerobaculia bacterium]|nr:ribbon-helix-helix domain-containing protein [Thermoanaerobaculia bacterium]